MEGGTVKSIFRIQLSYLVVFVQMARVFHLWSKGGLVTGALKWHLVDLGSASCVLKLLMALEKAFEVLLCFILLCLYVKQKKKKKSLKTICIYNMFWEISYSRCSISYLLFQALTLQKIHLDSMLQLR